MKKVLHVITSLDNCGTERYMINLLKGTYKDFDNIILYYTGDNFWKNELDQMNIKVYKYDGSNNNFQRMKYIRKIIRSEKVDIVYSYTYYNSAFVILSSFLTGVKKRITHSHRTSVDRKVNFFKKILCKTIISIFSTNCIACSKAAGDSLFLKFRKCIIIDNCIEIDKYKYDVLIRNNIRKKYHVNDDLVIGSIGRLDENKNQKFIIDLVHEFKKRNFKVKLFLLGDGNKKESLLDYVHKLKLDNDVFVLGNKSDANNYYNAFDVYVLSSFKEGLPFVLIEAQTNGLNCVVSDCVSEEANLNGKMQFLSLNESKEKWLNSIISFSKERNMDISKIEKKYSLNSMCDFVKQKIYK